MNKPASIDRASDIDQASAVLTIDLGAVRENYRRLRARVRSAECSAVVKADAYGLGAVEIASALLKEGCRTFFVAHGTEGVSLRQAVGYGPAIHVLNGLHPGTEQICAEAGLTAVANSQAQLAAWKTTARRLGRRLPVSVHVDTGMSRLGMPAEEVERLSPADFDGLDLTLVMSHLACAEETGSPSNELQRLAFESLRRKLPQAPASLANSSGVFLGDDFHFDMVRPGAALFGVNPTPHVTNPMREVVRLSARVIQTRDLGVGVGIGYGHTYRTNVPIRTVTIALGYADGWPRRAAGAAFYGGKRLPFIGRVSMDSIVLDGSSLSAGELRIGEFVEVISDGQTVDDIAGLSGTIGYEILTGLGSRYLRRYTGG